MTAIEVKTAIQKVLDEVPENILPEILNYLKQVQHQSSDQIKLNNNLKKILAEDKELFERLAQ
ncbi:hypothetical protein [Mucilaginibacter sp.]|uniref:hypothetical protein n=1 Tax=Mucilaginibacter sp. TaxID=1882438 RepID=UPI003D11045C